MHSGFRPIADKSLHCPAFDKIDEYIKGVIVTDRSRRTLFHRTCTWLLRKYRQHSDLNWALIDQALVSTVNFLTMVVLARLLGVEMFGQFSIAWLVLLFFKSIQTAIILSPLMSIGPKQMVADRQLYYGSVLVQQGIFALGTFILIAVGVWLAGAIDADLEIGSLALPLALAAAMDQLQDCVRRYFFTVQRGVTAFGVDLLCFGSRTLVLLLMLYFGYGDGAVALWLIFASAAVAVLVAFLAMDPIRYEPDFFISVCQRHWEFAKWIMGSAVLRWMSGHLMVFVSGGVIGAYSVGAIRSTTNVMAPIQMFSLALGNVAPVRAARAFHERGMSALLRYLGKLTLLATAFTAFIVVGGVLFAEPIVGFLYGDEYLPFAYLVYWWAGIHLVGMLQIPLEVGLRATEKTRPLFYSVLVEASFGILFSYVLASQFGLPGVMFGILLTKIIPVTFLSVSFARIVRKSA